jgi:hypothetical protein
MISSRVAIFEANISKNNAIASGAVSRSMSSSEPNKRKTSRTMDLDAESEKDLDDLHMWLQSDRESKNEESNTGSVQGPTISLECSMNDSLTSEMTASHSSLAYDCFNNSYSNIPAIAEEPASPRVNHVFTPYNDQVKAILNLRKQRNKDMRHTIMNTSIYENRATSKPLLPKDRLKMFDPKNQTLSLEDDQTSTTKSVTSHSDTF